MVDVDRIVNGIKSTYLSPSILFFEIIESTNDHTKDLIAEDSVEGTLVIVDQQSHGRGRQDHTWYSPAGGAYFSIVLKPKLSFDQTPLISLLVACAIARAIRGLYNIDVVLKWPNDIQVGELKLGGILSESVMRGNAILGLAIGIGINQNVEVSTFPLDIKDKSTSILNEVGHETSIEDLIAHIFNEIDSRIRRVEADSSYEAVISEWISLNATIGRNVLVHDDGPDFRGKATRVEQDGSLIVTTEEGKEIKVLTGSISHL
ncbi:MAG: biotin--[acetyl-CoA-carboxylase] ligase [Candidatus Thorarchaeota archaeon]|jgi:BirA family biotin operon repressor/biotin-[acetyl-CoA-carboxylase] ligase